MTPERWQQIETLVSAALERPTGDRPAFLAEACADDTGLRREAEALLASYGDSNSFLETPAIARLPGGDSGPRGIFTSDARFALRVDGADPVEVVVSAQATEDNETVDAGLQ